jgi:hypothetical protein
VRLRLLELLAVLERRLLVALPVFPRLAFLRTQVLPVFREGLNWPTREELAFPSST